jgi:hypothetical protein
MRTTPAEPSGAVLEYDAQGISLPPGEHTIGRDFGSFLRIDDPAVSRAHLKLHVDKGGVKVEDLGSTNGTFLNGTLLDGTADLVDGDELTIGSRKFVLRLGDEVGFEADETTPVNRPLPARETLDGLGAEDPRLEHTCPKCGPVPLDLSVCPGCGYRWPRGPAGVKTSQDHVAVEERTRKDQHHEVRMAARYSSRRMETVGMVHELSLSGAFIVADSVDSIGTRCRLVLHTKDGDCAEFDGFVRRVIHKGVGGRSGMGIEFVRLSDINTSWIREQLMQAVVGDSSG